MGSPEVGPLEDEIDKLADLDRLRVRSAEMRNRGRDALLDLKNQRWQELDSSAESALIVKALCDRRTGTRPPEDLVTNLEQVTCEEIFGASGDQSDGNRSQSMLTGIPDRGVIFLLHR